MPACRGVGLCSGPRNVSKNRQPSKQAGLLGSCWSVRGSGQPALHSLIECAAPQSTLGAVALGHVVPDSLHTVAAAFCACACGGVVVAIVLMRWPCAASVPRNHCSGGACATRKPGNP